MHPEDCIGFTDRDAETLMFCHGVSLIYITRLMFSKEESVLNKIIFYFGQVVGWGFIGMSLLATTIRWVLPIFIGDNTN